MNSAANVITADVGGRQRTFNKCSHMYLLDLGWCEAGTEVKISCSDVPELMVQAYALNLDSLDTAYQTLNAQTMTLDEWSDRSVKGYIDMQMPGKLVFSIPCEEGWTLYVDGKKTQMEPFMESLIGVTLSEGNHEIELHYETPGLKAGAAISAGAALMFLCTVFFHLFFKKNSKK